MNLNFNLKEAWKNKKLILDGVINRIQAKDEIKQIAETRKSICQVCPNMSKNAEKHGYKSERVDKHCILCGCPLEIKTYSLNASCPDNPPRWVAVASDDENHKIQQLIQDEQ